VLDPIDLVVQHGLRKRKREQKPKELDGAREASVEEGFRRGGAWAGGSRCGAAG
jgi:hypothetical protein